MSMIKAQWRSGFTRRWHSNPYLCHTVDTVDAHSNRVSKLASAIEPKFSRDGLIYAREHDSGEDGLGDVSGWYKRQNPEFSSRLDRAERANREDRLGIYLPVLSEYEAAIAGLADKLDAIMWARMHAPHIMETGDWQSERATVTQMAYDVISDRRILTEINSIINVG